MKEIPFRVIDRQTPKIWSRCQEEITQIVSSGRVVQGEWTERVEKQLQNYLDVDSVVMMSSCTSGLLASLMCVGVEPGDKVLISSLSFVATLNAILSLGGRPVFVDCSNAGSGFDMSKLQKVCQKESNIKAAVGVHLYGHPFDTFAVKKVFQSFDITLVEDRAQWFSKEKPWGQDDDKSLACYSFDPTKNAFSISTLGAVSTNDKRMAEKLRALRSQGWQGTRYLKKGLNAKASEISCCFLSEVMNDFESMEADRKKIVEFYIDYLEKSKIQFIDGHFSRKYSTWNKFVVVSEKRDLLKDNLRKSGIESRIDYTYTLPELVEDRGQYAYAEKLSARGLSLPVFPSMTLQEAQKVLAVVENTL